MPSPNGQVLGRIWNIGRSIVSLVGDLYRHQGSRKIVSDSNMPGVPGSSYVSHALALKNASLTLRTTRSHLQNKNAVTDAVRLVSDNL